MIINGEKLKTLSVFPSLMTVPDCIVTSTNKLGRGHGEAKFYIASKQRMYNFYGAEGFTARCFMLKTDLIAYMQAIKNEYLHPSQPYNQKDKFPKLWTERMKMIENLGDVIFFTIKDQNQIGGPRGYINSEDIGYQIIRKIALPLVSYIYSEKVGNATSPFFYWKLFVDFDVIKERQNGSLVFNYGLAKNKKSIEDKNPIDDKLLQLESVRITKSRDGQTKYREQLLEQCHFCPFTKVSDERLLIASHIKPWAASNDKEKIDPYNGYILSPLYDKLFDKGFITFTQNKHLILSEFISNYTWKQLNLKNDTYIEMLPMDDKRIKYLDFHHKSVFKGSNTF